MKYIFLFFIIVFSAHLAESEEICFDCHSDKTLTTEKNGKTISLYVDIRNWKKSVHIKDGCLGCHVNFDPEEIPHNENIQKVKCSKCHETEVVKFESSLHGKALKQGRSLAPNCQTCHGKHNILSSKNQESKTYSMNIPYLCGQCHKEGTPVSKLRNISKHNIIENYSQSIHGEGLYKRGLTVTAVCTSCHMSHDILPHENPKSSINRNNIPKTCMQCHSQIEKVHTKIIDGKLWEKKPHLIPVCVDCHQPHKTRSIQYDRSYPNEVCMKCHSNQNIYKTVNGKKINLHVNESHLKNSIHKDLSCIKCHSNINTEYKPVCINSGKVDCSACHAQESNDYNISYHGVQHKKGNNDAPYCTDCHTSHTISSRFNKKSPIYVQNIPNLCGNCHRVGKKASRNYKGVEHEMVEHYKESIHGKGLLESGLIVTATCVDCHTTHRELPSKDPNSSVNHKNIASTCGKCHQGIYEQLNKSIHSPNITKTDKTLPVCNDCHSAHTINRTDADDFREMIINQCGKCHKDVTETYFDTFHGKVSKLGSGKTAKCSDCHGSHFILPVSYTESSLSRKNIIQTCKKCHANSNRKFVGYLTHATHHNKDKYPFLFYTFWFMTILLVSTFSFFGLHTLLWIPRAFFEKRKHTNMIERKKNE